MHAAIARHTKRAAVVTAGVLAATVLLLAGATSASAATASAKDPKNDYIVFVPGTTTDDLRSVTEKFTSKRLVITLGFVTLHKGTGQRIDTEITIPDYGDYHLATYLNIAGRNDGLYDRETNTQLPGCAPTYERHNGDHGTIAITVKRSCLTPAGGIGQAKRARISYAEIFDQDVNGNTWSDNFTTPLPIVHAG